MGEDSEKTYFMVLNDNFIIFPSEKIFMMKSSEKIMNYIFSAEIKKIVLFFQSSKYKKISEIGILCEIKKNYRGEENGGGPKIYLTPIMRVKRKDGDLLEQINGYIEYEIVKNDFSDCSKEYTAACFSEIIDQINNIKFGEGQAAAFYMIFVSINKIPADLENQDIRIIYQHILDDFCNNPEKLAVWIDALFNEILNDDLRGAKWHILNELNVMTRFEVLVENLVPLVCEFINQKYPAPEKTSLPVSANGKNKKANPELSEMEEKIRISRMPPEARNEALRELNRLQGMNPEASEYTVCRTYIDWLISMPWGIFTEDNFDIKNAECILDEDHFGLREVKNRILETLAVQKLNPGSKASVICFIGPPGTGKSSVAASIARALGRKFIRISLGSMRDSAEIKGHRRTYIGALPGKIIKEIRCVGSQNPVICLDELDKLREDMHGDPASALLEVLDREQNNGFMDHYLDVPFDLSRILFIATANIAETILPALKDRLDIIEFYSYTEREKLEIAKRHLVPKQIKEHGLSDYNIKFTDDALLNITRFYTRESGVRHLENKIGMICRKLSRCVVGGEFIDNKDNIVDCPKVSGFLGIRQNIHSKLFQKDMVGISVGLVWSETGGDIMHIGASETWNLEEKFKVTGLPGEMMFESVHNAITYLNENRKKIGISDDHFDPEFGIHVNFRYGGIPKDGPSAGIAIVAAIYSAQTNKPIRRNVAFTGEIMAKGIVDPIGGLKEKVLAAKNAGIKKLFLPKGNMPHIDSLDKGIKEGIKFFFIQHLDEIFLKYQNKIFRNLG